MNYDRKTKYWLVMCRSTGPAWGHWRPRSTRCRLYLWISFRHVLPYIKIQLILA